MSEDNVKVCCRYRPVNKIEKGKGEDKIVVKFESEQQVKIEGQRGGNKFTLDYIFKPDSTQEIVYEQTGKPLVQEVLKGINATMFAYGQTGSGKTHTMSGEIGDPDMMGMIPRMVDEIFDQAMDLDEGISLMVKVSFMEIYNEQIRDLMEPGSRGLQIRESSSRGIYVEGLSEHWVSNADDIFDHMEIAQESRACASTNMNDTSSRSHSVFTLCLEQTSANGSKKTSKLMLVDLAGSEKVRKTQAVGARLKEAASINGSLSALVSVIAAITSHKKHVPYRDSKLTRILSDSLGGNSKTCIIVCASPCEYNVDETISTMRFGVQCKKVKNKPKVNQELSIAQYKAIVLKMQQEVDRYKKTVDCLNLQKKALVTKLLDVGGERGQEYVDEALGDAEQLIKDMEDDEKDDEEDDDDESDSDDDEEDSRRRPNKERKKLANISLHDPKGLKDHIEYIEDLYNKECTEKEKYMDDVADLKDELDRKTGRLEELEAKAGKSDKNVKKMAGQIGEFRLYKTKLEFSEKDHKIEVSKLKQKIEDLQSDTKNYKNKAREASMKGSTESRSRSTRPLTSTEKQDYDTFHPDTLKDLGDCNEDEWKLAMKDQYDELYKKWMNRVQTCRQLERTGGNLAGGAGRGANRDKIYDLVSSNDALKCQVKDMSEDIEKMKRQIKRKDQQQRYSDALRKDFSNQLQQMEQAVFMTNQIHNRDRKQFDREIQEKNQELQRLKHFLKLLSQRNKKMSKGNRVRMPVNRRGVDRSRGGRGAARDDDRRGGDRDRGVRRRTKRPSIAIRGSSPGRDNSRSPSPQASNRPRGRIPRHNSPPPRKGSPPRGRGQDISDDEPATSRSSNRERYSTPGH